MFGLPPFATIGVKLLQPRDRPRKRKAVGKPVSHEDKPAVTADQPGGAQDKGAGKNGN